MLTVSVIVSKGTNESVLLPASVIVSKGVFRLLYFLAKYRHPRQVCITINGLQSFSHCSVLDLWFLFVLDLGSEITVQWWFRLIET